MSSKTESNVNEVEVNIGAIPNLAIKSLIADTNSLGAERSSLIGL